MSDKHFWKWSVANEAAEGEEPERELQIVGPIAEESWFGDEATPAEFETELKCGKGKVKVHISSPGGDCIAASRIYTMLKEYEGEVCVQIDGLAASAASVIAMAGDEVTMSPTALMMIHDPLTMAYGNKNDLKEAIRVLDEFKEAIVNAYEDKTHMDRKKICGLMEGPDGNGTWMNARKALELGFIDRILFEDGEEVDDCGYAFSAAAACNSLLTKVSAKYTHEVPEQPEEDDEAPVTPVDTTDDKQRRERMLALYKEV